MTEPAYSSENRPDPQNARDVADFAYRFLSNSINPFTISPDEWSYFGFTDNSDFQDLSLAAGRMLHEHTCNQWALHWAEGDVVTTNQALLEDSLKTLRHISSSRTRNVLNTIEVASYENKDAFLQTLGMAIIIEANGILDHYVANHG